MNPVKPFLVLNVLDSANIYPWRKGIRIIIYFVMPPSPPKQRRHLQHKTGKYLGVLQPILIPKKP